MGIEEARALLDEMDAGRETFVRDLGGPEVLKWMHQEMRRRHEARDARERLEQQRTTALPAETLVPSPTVSETSLSLTRRVEVLEAQLKHLARKRETAQRDDLREWAMADAPPWKRKSPKKKTSKPLTAKQKAEARARARKAGRKYPNLVDNMAVARKSRKKTSKKKSSRS